MASIEHHLDRMNECAEVIQSLSFERESQIFVNALLHGPAITNLIRDSLPYESSLFSILPSTSANGNSSSNPNQSAAFESRIKRIRRAPIDTSSLLSAATSATPSSTTAAAVDPNEIGPLVAAAKQLLAILPNSDMLKEVSELEKRYDTAVRGVMRLEDLVDEQKSQLDVLQDQRHTYHQSIVESVDLTTDPEPSEDDIQAERDAVEILEAQIAEMQARV